MRKAMSRKQLVGGMLGAVLFFGYLIVATVFHDNKVVMLVMVGPYGLFAGIYFLVVFAVGGFFMNRERKRLEKRERERLE